MPVSKLLSQTKDPDLILTRVKEAFTVIEDYEVDVHIKIDVEFLKVPEGDAKLYFKQPDKIHVESEKFALLPKLVNDSPSQSASLQLLAETFNLRTPLLYIFNISVADKLLFQIEISSIVPLK